MTNLSLHADDAAAASGCLHHLTGVQGDGKTQQERIVIRGLWCVCVCFKGSPWRWESGLPLRVWAADPQQKHVGLGGAWASEHPGQASTQGFHHKARQGEAEG